MSKTISIKKNGTETTLTVDKLRLPKTGGGTKDWVPADGKNLVKLEVKQNGTYKASDFDAYGISEVKVKCTLNGGSATSKADSKALKNKHNPAPAEGGQARSMSAHHLETPEDGGGMIPWVPESEVALGTRSVNVDNRTYKAADDGKYGWSEFTVYGITITQDGDIIHHEDGDGEQDYILPTSIRVVRPPNYTTWPDGANIDFTGMVVKAYTESGALWTDGNHPDGVIPLEELMISPTVADLDAVEFAEYDDGDGIRAARIRVIATYDQWNEGEYLRTEKAVGLDDQATFNLVFIGTNVVCTLLITAYEGRYYACLFDGHGQENIQFRHVYQNPYYDSFYYYGNYNYPGSPLTTKFQNYSNQYATTITVPISDKDPEGTDLDDLHPIGEGGQPISISWNRPWDGETLSTTLYITVVPGYGGGNESAGGIPTPGDF